MNDLSFVIPPGTKCGIVGRTGAGKSSIIQVLFQIYPHQKGQVLIDGIDISTIGVR